MSEATVSCVNELGSGWEEDEEEENMMAMLRLYLQCTLKSWKATFVESHSYPGFI
jgi:hypothetical protein